jgi:hypothetical protein
MFSPRLPFQVLLHVLFEHAVGYALLALKEVEEISLLLPQVGQIGGFARLHCSPSGRQAPACTARSHVAGRAGWGERGRESSGAGDPFLDS